MRISNWIMLGAMVTAAVIYDAMARDAWAAENAPTEQSTDQSADQPAPAPELADNNTCLGCHGNAGFSMPRADETVRELFVDKDQFGASVHGKFLRCIDCHTKITEIPHTKVAKSLIEWRRSIPPLCGKCHAVELSQYLTSIHGREVIQNANPKAAICSDCHTAHGILNAEASSFRVAIVRNCGNCHQANLKSYLATYHGQVTTLGYGSTAKCYDCHGSHAIQEVDDPRSMVYPAHRVATCWKCHANATPGFLTFQPHATTNNFEKYPYTWLASKFMLLLILGTFLFFWTHSAFWYYRELRDHFTGARRPHVQTGDLLQGKTVYYRRWSALWRLAHLGFAVCTIMLIFTGMTLFYANSFWAPAVQRMFGGPPITGTIHRIFAVSWLSIFFAHLCYVTVRIARNWKTFRWFGPTSMIPNWEDVTDIIKMYKWFLGFGPKPLFDKWSYWEKFDYWAPFWGATIVGVSGAMLWFKYLTASILPGWVLNVATIFHGEEAFLAAAFLFTVHFFNNHWRPENFPLDILMFTGVMPLERFRREHTLEYSRLVETDQLKNYLVDAPSRPMTTGSKILGFSLMAAGLILLVLIFIGFARSIGG